jgi:hypothetical protein
VDECPAAVPAQPPEHFILHPSTFILHRTIVWSRFGPTLAILSFAPESFAIRWR